MARHVVLLVILLTPGAALAHRFELAINIDPAFAMFPAVAPQAKTSTLVPSLGGTIGAEFYVLNDLAVVLRLGYLHGLADSQIGEATFSNRTGLYYFAQSVALASAGARIETPPTWMPVTFSASVEAGLVVLIQTNQDLRNNTGISYGLALEPVVRPIALLSARVGFGGRVTNQIRLTGEPVLHVFFADRPLVGGGVSVSLSFLFYP